MKEGIFGEKVIDFYSTIQVPKKIPKEILPLNPYRNNAVKNVITAFYTKYFNDSNNRVYIIGINPGRLGAGATGIAFTDTDALEICGIRHKVESTKELSAGFIYKVIEKYGGPEKFYKNFFITSICPVGFIKNGVNFNYYDEASFLKLILPYIEKTFAKQHAFGAKPTAIVLGKGLNYKVIEKINKDLKFFKKILPIEHPRFVMQYRRKRVEEYVEMYQKVLESSLQVH